MDMNRYSDRDPGSLAKSTPDHWVLFLVEGVALILLGLSRSRFHQSPTKT